MGITVKQMIDLLKRENPDDELDFGGLDFYRLKIRGEKVHVEFNQGVYLDEKNKVIVENHTFDKE